MLLFPCSDNDDDNLNSLSLQRTNSLLQLTESPRPHDEGAEDKLVM